MILNSMLMRETGIKSENLSLRQTLALLSTSLPAPLVHTVREHLMKEIMFRTMLYECPWAGNTHTPW